MTIQQEAFEKIMQLPEEGIRLILVMADEIARQQGICFHAEGDNEESTLMTRKKKAFEDMLELRERSTYPKDFDYEKVLEEALVEKYNIIN